jgi:hypothetical protein
VFQRRQIGAAGQQRRVQGAVLGGGRRVRRCRRTGRVRDGQPAVPAAQQHPVGAVREAHLRRREAGPQPVQRAGAVRQCAGVPVEFALVGERAHHGQDTGLGQREGTVVLQQHHGLFGGAQRQRAVFGGVERCRAREGPALRVELAQPEAHRQQPGRGGVDVRLRQQALRQGAVQPPEHHRGVLAVVGEAVHPGAQRGGGGLLMGVEVAFGVRQIGRRPGVRADHQGPFRPGPQLLGEQR